MGLCVVPRQGSSTHVSNNLDVKRAGTNGFITMCVRVPFVPLVLPGAAEALDPAGIAAAEGEGELRPSASSNKSLAFAVIAGV